MAEALLQAVGGERFEAFSAGFEPGQLNPLAVAAMSELGINISGNATKSVFSLYRAGVLFDYVITVCDEASREKCPIFPGYTKRLHWSFEDPSRLKGSEAAPRAELAFGTSPHLRQSESLAESRSQPGADRVRAAPVAHSDRSLGCATSWESALSVSLTGW